MRRGAEDNIKHDQNGVNIIPKQFQLLFHGLVIDIPGNKLNFLNWKTGHVFCHNLVNYLGVPKGLSTS